MAWTLAEQDGRMNVQRALVLYCCLFTANIILLLRYYCILRGRLLSKMASLQRERETETKTETERQRDRENDARAELALVHLLRSDIILLPLYC